MPLSSFIFGRVAQRQPPEKKMLIKISQNSQENLKKSVNDYIWLQDGEQRRN